MQRKIIVQVVLTCKYGIMELAPMFDVKCYFSSLGLYFDAAVTY